MNNTIRKLTEHDRMAVLEYLATEPAHTTFFRADVRDYGFDDSRFQIWGLPTPLNSEPFGYVLCLFYGCFHVYSKAENVDFAAILQHLNENNIEFKMVAGKESHVLPLAKFIPFQNIHRTCLAELRQENFAPHIDKTIPLEWATVQDAEEILRLRTSMEEFRDFMMPIEQLVDLLAMNKGRVLNIRENGRLVSSATESCMGRIGYVCTDPEFRGRGYASVLVSKLSETLLSEGTVPSLAYENPAAGSIYRRLGFREVGRMAVLSK